MHLVDIDSVIETYSGLARKALDYTQMMKRMVAAAKQPGFTAESWGPIAALVDTEHFERIGNFKEVMNWPEYVAFLTAWATSSEWDCSFKRVTEAHNLVLLELEERSRSGGIDSVVNSVSVYEFDESERIAHIDIYLQMPLPDPEGLRSYAGIKISE